jgi:hypothetical protein
VAAVHGQDDVVLATTQRLYRENSHFVAGNGACFIRQNNLNLTQVLEHGRPLELSLEVISLAVQPTVLFQNLSLEKLYELHGHY